MLLMLQAFDSLELTEEKINAITDQIPQKPVTIVEGTSYMAIIIAAFTVSMQRSGHSSGDAWCRQCSRCFSLLPHARLFNHMILSASCTLMCTCCLFDLQVLGFFVYNFVTNFILEPTYQTCFNNTLQKLKQDPRITVRLGNDIVGEWQHTLPPAGPADWAVDYRAELLNTAGTCNAVC
jgi:import inner membrane translocase subunit TIM21